MESWIKKYEPKRLQEIIGQQSNVNKIIDNIRNNKHVLIYGKAGTGKTSSVYAIANELDYELIEINASDFRNKEQINIVLKNALEQRSIFMKKKLLLIDEIDGISGSKDRGGIPAIVSLLNSKKVPIIITGNDIWNKKFYNIRKKTVNISFSGLNYLSIANILENICIKEGIKYNKDILKIIARRSDGDARAAINDLQIVASGKKEINEKDIEFLSDRDRTEKLQEAIMRIFKTIDFNISYEALNNVDEDYEKIMMFIDENLPKEYKGKGLSNAYDVLSKADIFSKRIKSRQNWRYLVYIFFLLSVGVALSKEEKTKGFVQYSLTSSRITKMYFGNQKNLAKKDIAEKIREKLHCSKDDAIKLFIPLLSLLSKKYDEYNINKLMLELELDKDDIKVLREMG